MHPKDPSSGNAVADANSRSPGLIIGQAGVEVPYVAAGCEVAWAEQAVGGEREFRYRVSNPGTPPLTTVVLPAGRQHGVSTALAPAGWTATLGALATTFSAVRTPVACPSPASPGGAGSRCPDPPCG